VRTKHPPQLLLSVLLVQNLNSDDQAVVLKALRLAPEGRLRKDGLRALSSLLVHGNNKVMAAVSTQLRSLSLGPVFRERVSLAGFSWGEVRVVGSWCLRLPILPIPRLSCASWTSWKMGTCRLEWPDAWLWAVSR
jgi:hypothetical protein